MGPIEMTGSGTRLQINSSFSTSILRTTLVLLTLVFATTWLVITPATAQATSPAVSNCQDSGTGSLRHAIGDATSGAIITFAHPLRCSTITLSGAIVIRRHVTIDGPGASVLTVSGDSDVEVFRIATGVTASVSGLTISAGSSPYGGGIYNGGKLTLSRSTVSGNVAASGGGGIWNNGSLRVVDSTLSGNQSGYFGGGIYSGPHGVLRVLDSTLSNNSIVDNNVDYSEYAYGGAIYADGAATVSGSTFSSNHIQSIGGGGGGGAIYDGGKLIVTRSRLADNSADIIVGAVLNDGGGAILNTGTLDVVDSSLTGNSTNVDGGGIANGWSLRVRGSTLSGNRASVGANIYNNETVPGSDGTS